MILIQVHGIICKILRICQNQGDVVENAKKPLGYSLLKVDYVLNATKKG